MATLEELAEELERSHAELEQRLADPTVYADRREAANLGRRLKELDPALRAAREWRQASTDLADAKGDPELSSFAGELEADVARLEEELRLALVERDPADAKDVIVEVRQGVGGDEAALWAGDVARMLQRYAERRGYRTELLSVSESDGGGVKEQVFAVKGDGAYSVFKWEGGTHRVQRVPATESQGRIHTSTATVAVMPEVEEVEVTIEDKDLKIDVYRSTGRAGSRSTRQTRQYASRTSRPGSSSRCRTRSRSSRTSRRRCACSARASTRQSASASRRARCRPPLAGRDRRARREDPDVQLPENRLTDHRVKHTVHRLDQVLDGDLEEFTDSAPGRGAPARAREPRSEPRTVRDVSGVGRRTTSARWFGVDRHARGGHPSAESTRSFSSRTSSARPRRPRRRAPRTRPSSERLARSLRDGCREPLQYIVGEWGFRRLTLTVDGRALIPRPETETVVERCLALLTGVDGPVSSTWARLRAIALAIADEHPGARVTGSTSRTRRSRSPARMRQDRASRRASSARHASRPPGVDWDLVVSNPPYVRPEEAPGSQPEVVDWEPHVALFGGGHTETLVRAAATRWRRAARSCSRRYDERASAVAELLERTGFTEVVVTSDLAGRDRVVEGRRRMSEVGAAIAALRAGRGRGDPDGHGVRARGDASTSEGGAGALRREGP
jgi:peptide chain release factor 1